VSIEAHNEPARTSRRQTVAIIAFAVIFFGCGIVTLFLSNNQPQEASFQGHTASYWLDGVFGTPHVMPQAQCLEAFRKMGTNAEPVLVAAMAARESPLARLFRRAYPRLPAMIRLRVNPPRSLMILQSAAMFVVVNTDLSGIVPKLLPLLEDPDSQRRSTVIAAVGGKISPQDAPQVGLLLLAAADPDSGVRAGALHCLRRIGRAAASASEPVVSKLCRDGDANVRTIAAWTLWSITGQTNVAVSVLEDALGATIKANDARNSHWSACYLLEMGVREPLLTTTFINTLTNGHCGPGERMSACSCLGKIGPPATTALPALRLAMQDREAEVRRRAKLAIEQIDASPKSER
jgi:hypothetical protein